MKENSEAWVLYQVFDAVLERWSPIYCSPTRVWARMELDEMVKKTSGRPVMVKFLGDMKDGNYVKEFSNPFRLGDFSLLGEQNEVSRPE